MFDLTRPCKTCPFRIGQGERFQLEAERLAEIRTADAFQCHKTVDYGHWNDRRKRQGDRPQQCAGLMAVLAREGADNTIMQVAQRLGHLDTAALDPKREAYSSWAAALKAHRPKIGGRKNGKTKRPARSTSQVSLREAE